MLRPGMRAYLVPLVAGIMLTASAFLPWVIVGEVTLNGVPELPALWIAGLGALAAVLAALSLITRKNSRHPLLLIGLVATAIMFLSWRIMPEAVTNRARIRSQALAIVEGRAMAETPAAVAGIGMYLGLASAVTLAAFGMTIIVKRTSRPYIVDDDVE